MTAEPRPAAPGRGDRVLPWLFVCASAVLLLLQQGQITIIDGFSMYNLTRALVLHHSIDVGRTVGAIPGLNGYYSKYGVALPVLSIPAFVAGSVAARFLGHTEYVRQAFVTSTMPLICAALVCAIYALGRRVGGSPRAALLVAVGSVAGTYLLPYTKDFFSEPLTALALVVAVERMAAHRPAQSGLAMAVAVLTRPQELVVAPVLAGVLAWREGPRRAVGAAAILVGVAAMVGGYNLVRFGSALDSGYHGEGFTTPLLTGLVGLLLNPGKSLILFAPAVVLLVPAMLQLWRREPALVVLLTANFALTFLLAATWHSWEGGWSWGPRLLVAAFIPAMGALAPWLTTATRTRAAAILFAAGFLVSAPTLVVGTTAQVTEHRYPWPTIWRQAALVPGVIGHTIGHWRDPVVTGAQAGASFVNTWQVGALRLLHGRGAAIALAGSVLLLAVALWSGQRLARELSGGQVRGAPSR